MKLELITRRPAQGVDRKNILFIHGSWHGAACWDEYFLPYFAAHGYTAHAVSLRGHGKSGCDKRFKLVRIADYVADVERAVAGLPQPLVLVGHSMGGFILQHYLENHRAPAAVLMTPVPHAGALPTTLRLAVRHPWMFAKVNVLLRLSPMIDDPRLPRRYFFQANLDPAKAERFRSFLCDESYLAFLDMLVLDLPRRGCGGTPVLVQLAGRDRVVFPGGVRKTAARYGTTPAAFPGASHDLMLDDAWRAAADHILEWLKAKGL
jgi:pimeloyl-ACP methyl ester carboxylesterase